MKRLFILVTSVFSVAISAPTLKSGQFITGFDRESNVILTNTIQVNIHNSDSADLQIEGEELFAGTRENGKVSAYVAKPKKYFFYTLDLKPKTKNIDGRMLVIKGGERSGTDLVVSTSFCNEGSNALLTAYVGDGTQKTFCASIK